ncbi:MAG TPA: hypothetical protein VKT51_11415 [Candidatus Eremiobacteraceae bacterium]|nr:hypothetical protein [Candidatus Eremiobacteraceae bacterium]
MIIETPATAKPSYGLPVTRVTTATARVEDGKICASEKLVDPSAVPDRDPFNAACERGSTRRDG